MKAISSLRLYLGTSALIAGVYGGIAFSRLTALESELAKKRVEDARVERVIRGKSQRLLLAKELAHPTAKPASGTTRAATEILSNDKIQELFGRFDGALSANSEYRPKLRLQYRRQAEKFYAPFFKDLQLTDEEWSRFLELAVEKALVPLDVETLSQKGSMDVKSPEGRQGLTEMINQLQADLDDQLKELLGPARFDRCTEYARLAPAWEQLDSISRRLESSRAPLSPDQAAGLLAKLLGFLRDDPSLVRGDLCFPDAVLHQSEALLSPAQVQAIKQLQLEQNAQAQVTEIVAELAKL